ncbi:MAG: hypothetical protein ACRDXD_08920 [Acidimicrobiia bacterium]
MPIEPSTVREAVSVKNETDQRIHIFYPRPGREADLGPVNPGNTVLVSGTPECTDRPLIARNDAGEEVARREPPICHGETWVIGDE